MSEKVNLANLISILRVGLAFVAVFFLFNIRGEIACFVAMILIALSVILDMVDGIVARALGYQSSFGDLLDRTADYIVANTMWTTLSVMGLIPVWIPIITTARDLVVSSHHKNYHSKFQWLSSSRMVRATYGVMKLASWELTILSRFFDFSFLPEIFVRATVGLCLLRALPILSSFTRPNKETRL